MIPYQTLLQESKTDQGTFQTIGQRKNGRPNGIKFQWIRDTDGREFKVFVPERDVAAVANALYAWLESEGAVQR